MWLVQVTHLFWLSVLCSSLLFLCDLQAALSTCWCKQSPYIMSLQQEFLNRDAYPNKIIRAKKRLSILNIMVCPCWLQYYVNSPMCVQMCTSRRDDAYIWIPKVAQIWTDLIFKLKMSSYSHILTQNNSFY